MLGTEHVRRCFTRSPPGVLSIVAAALLVPNSAPMEGVDRRARGYSFERARWLS